MKKKGLVFRMEGELEVSLFASKGTEGAKDRNRVPDIYVLKKNRQSGPYSRNQLLEQFQSGTLTTEDLWWKAGMKNWHPLSNFFDF